MIKKLATLLFLLTFKTISGQTIYEPQILILAPNFTVYEKEFEEEIAALNLQFPKISADKIDPFLPPDFKSKPENVQRMMRSEIEFMMNMDFFKQASFLSEQHLAYTFFEKFPDLLFLLKDEKSGSDISSLKAHSIKSKLQYVLNFPRISIYKQEGMSMCDLTIQLYDYRQDSILLEKTYKGDWVNPGFEFNCKEFTINCTISNALSFALPEITKVIAANIPSLLAEKQLHKSRFDILVNDYLSKPFEKSKLSEIIPQADSKVQVKDAYQALFSADSSKFIAFFVDSFRSQDEGRDYPGISADMDMNPPKKVDEKFHISSYVVAGVKSNGKWYYKKSNATSFTTASLIEGQKFFFNFLQSWNFFIDNSNELNPAFWETNHFAMVPDLTKDPDWEEYKDNIWQSDEINNRPYVGQYEIIAEQLRDEKEVRLAKIENEIVETYFNPLARKLKEEDGFEKASLLKMFNKTLLLYSDQMSAIICPVMVNKAGKDALLRYYVLIKDNSETKLFEWNYLKPSDFTNINNTPNFMDQINTLTFWNYSLVTLDDPQFWDRYVLLKEKGKYKYLVEMK